MLGKSTLNIYDNDVELVMRKFVVQVEHPWFRAVWALLVGINGQPRDCYVYVVVGVYVMDNICIM